MAALGSTNCINEREQLMTHDDDLERFAEQGAVLPPPQVEGRVENDGASIWYAAFGAGFPVVLLHGGLGHAGNWAHQVPDLVAAGYRAVVVDSRGHGRSTRDERPFSYDLMATDVLAVMDALEMERAAFVGWSDGACTALALARQAPERAAGVFFFACNVDPAGTKPFEPTPVIDRCFARHQKDYAALSPTPEAFGVLAEDLQKMQASQPNYSARDLEAIGVPVTIVQAEFDEFIKREHAEYMARAIPGAEYVLLPQVSHFAPIQRPDAFNAAVRAFMERVAA